MFIRKRTNVGFLKPLYTFCNVLGEAPLYDFAAEKLITSRIFLGYQVLVISSLIIGNYYCLEESNAHALSKMNLHMKLSTAASTVLLGVHPILSIYASYRYKKTIEYMLVTLNRFKSYSRRKEFYVEVLILHVMILYVTVGMLTVRLLQGRVPDYETFLFVVRYMIFIRNILIYNIVKTMEGCFAMFNEYMEVFREVNFMVVYREIQRGKPIVVDNLKMGIMEAREKYEEMCGLIDAFSKAFGLDMILLFADFLTIIIAFLNILVYPWKKIATVDDQVINSIRISYGVIIFLQLMTIIRTCDGARGNAKKTGLITARLMQDDVLKPILGDLLLLRERTDLCPSFGALGLFTLDSGSLLASLGLLVSYLIMTLGGTSH